MKKLLAVILTLTFILSTSVIGVSAAQSKEGFQVIEEPDVVGSVTIGFTNPEGWDEIYAYAYCRQPNWCGTTENAPYPGVKVEKRFVKGYGEIYTYTYASGLFEEVIFNDGSEEKPKIDVYKESVYELMKIDDFGEMEYEYSYDEIYEHFLSTADEVPEYVMVRIMSNTTLPSLTIDILGNYVLYGYNTYYPLPYLYGIYLPKDNKVMSIEDAYNEGVTGIDKALEKCNLARLIGDANNDGKLNIKDATYIQKILAKMVNPYLDDLSDWNLDGKLPIGFISDFNRDGKRTVQDATAIQKYLANIDIKDKELVEKINYINSLDPDTYASDCIVVTLNSNEYRDYEQYDFPEFYFKKVDRLEDFDENKPDTYVLYLEEPSHVNVVEAIKALWHRIGKDLESIDINGIVYPD